MLASASAGDYERALGILLADERLDSVLMLFVPPIVTEANYGLTMRSRGQFVAIDATSGKTLWHTQGREGENASILGSPSWVLASTTDGSLVVARANPQKYEEVLRYQLAQSALWAHPAITGSSIIVKDVAGTRCGMIPPRRVWLALDKRVDALFAVPPDGLLEDSESHSSRVSRQAPDSSCSSSWRSEMIVDVVPGPRRSG